MKWGTPSWWRARLMADWISVGKAQLGTGRPSRWTMKRRCSVVRFFWRFGPSTGAGPFLFSTLVPVSGRGGVEAATAAAQDTPPRGATAAAGGGGWRPRVRVCSGGAASCGRGEVCCWPLGRRWPWRWWVWPVWPGLGQCCYGRARPVRLGGGGRVPGLLFAFLSEGGGAVWARARALATSRSPSSCSPCAVASPAQSMSSFPNRLP